MLHIPNDAWPSDEQIEDLIDIQNESAFARPRLDSCDDAWLSFATEAAYSPASPIPLGTGPNWRTN